ncbi:MAG: right-handed parallel beta-helix repeat-containing protein [Planctomycetes bacterium]|nr:right-handed parallel beta-helix repeat-containing protein [Planctomycetota bacterium]
MKNFRFLAGTLPISLCIVIAGAWTALAGVLEPPAGPVGPTMNSLEEIHDLMAALAAGLEARTPVQSLPGSASAVHVIDEPGSYYLTANVIGQSGQHGIFIASPNVTLDLNGFALIGVPSSLDGILANVSGNKNIVITNGTIHGWGGIGVHTQQARNCRLENLQASDNGGHGLHIGDNSTVIGCISQNNGGIGIFAATGGAIGSTISNCMVQGNAGGINAAKSLIRGNTATGNGVNIAGGNATIIDNHAP